MKQRIEKNLTKNLTVKFLQITDNSRLHAGHAGNSGTKETHFAIKIAAKELENLGKIAAHRKINSLLKDEFKNGLHALELKIIHSAESQQD